MPDVADAARLLARHTVGLLDIATHHGAHPRFGVLDVVPFVPFVAAGASAAPRAAVPHRDAFAAWAGRELALPSFLYGPLGDGSERSLPEVRRRAFRGLVPDAGPAVPHPSAGATAVGARGVLLAWNMWVSGADHTFAGKVAAALRSDEVRALAFDLAAGTQLSCNLVRPLRVGPDVVFDRAAALLAAGGAGIERCELVGLAPAALLMATPRHRWAELALSEDATVEARLEARGVAASPS